MKKIVFVCPKDNYVEVNKVVDKSNIVRDKKCPNCQTPMNFIRKNKKKYKVLAKKAG